MLFFLYWSPAFVEYEQRISSIDFWDPVKFEVAYAARTRFSNQWIRDPVSICRGRLYTVYGITVHDFGKMHNTSSVGLLCEELNIDVF